RNRGPPADATRSPRLAATRSARPAAAPAPAAPQTGQTAAHTTAAPETAPPNPSMITNRTPAPTRRRSTGGLTGYIGRDVSITIFTASSRYSGEKFFFGRGNFVTFPVSRSYRSEERRVGKECRSR